MDFSDALKLLKSGKRVSREIFEEGLWVQILNEEGRPRNLILCDSKPEYLGNEFRSKNGFYYFFWQVGFDDLIADDWFEVD